ncbi:hypothetical protein WA158_003304 [Blastocystis sp. Blastoise]
MFNFGSDQIEEKRKETDNQKKSGLPKNTQEEKQRVQRSRNVGRYWSGSVPQWKKTEETNTESNNKTIFDKKESKFVEKQDKRLARVKNVDTKDKERNLEERNRRIEDELEEYNRIKLNNKGDNDEEEMGFSEEEEEKEEEEKEKEKMNDIDLRRHNVEVMQKYKKTKEEEEEEEEEWGKEGKEEGNDDDEYEYDTESESEEDEEEKKIIRPLFKLKVQRNTIKTEEQIKKEQEEEEKKKKEAIERRKLESQKVIIQYNLDQDESTKEKEDQEIIKNSNIDEDKESEDEIEFSKWREREIIRLRRERNKEIERQLEEKEKDRRQKLTDSELYRENLLSNENIYNRKKGHLFTFKQKYYHKGAFYVDEDSIKNKEDVRLRDYQQPTESENVHEDGFLDIQKVKDFGKRSRSKWTNISNEDTTNDGDWLTQARNNLGALKEMKTPSFLSVFIVSNQNMVPNKNVIVSNKVHTLKKEKKTYQCGNRTQYWKSYNYYEKSMEYMNEFKNKKPKKISNKVIGDMSKGREVYSYYQIYMPKYHQGLRYAYMSNICLNTQNNEILYYYRPNDKSYRRITEIMKKQTEHYRFGFQFQEIAGLFPSFKHTVIRKKHIALSFAAWIRHIGHILETAFTVLNLVDNPNYYQGPIDYFIYPNIKDELAYNLEMMEVIKQFADLYDCKVFFNDSFFREFNISLIEDPIVCFDQIVIVDRNEDVCLGGILTNSFTTDLLRANIYRRFHFLYQRYNKNKYDTLVINRLGRRKFSNIDEIEDILQNSFSDFLNYSIAYFDHESFEYQVKAVYNNDIIFISHGQGEMTLLFAKPYTVCIEGNTPYFYERFGHILSILYRLYIIHPNNQYSLRISKSHFKPCLNDTLLVTYGGDCKISTYTGNILLYKEYIITAFQEAIDYLNGIDFDCYLPDKSFIF